MLFCPYCHNEAKWCENKEIYGRNYGKSYMCYYCKLCDAYVGCHNNSKRSLGQMANKELRDLRRKCHKLFDLYWWDGESRAAAYRWLQDKMKMHRTQAHIGNFNKEQCLKLLNILKEELKTK